MNEPAVVELRQKVKPVVTEGIRPEQVDLTIALKDGRTLNRRIDHAVGSLEKPMSDAALEGKFADLAEGILAKDQVRRVMDLCWGVEKLASAAEIAKAGAAVG